MSTQRIPLQTGWQFAASDPVAALEPERLGDLDWKPAQVPGTVQSSLLALGLIPDPYLDINVRELGWIEEQDWWFRCSISPPPVPEGARLELSCLGLDTVARLYINGTFLGDSENMWLPFRADLTPHLLAGRNELIVHFPALAGLLVDPTAWWGTMRKQAGARLRKCQCGFGWDFVPRLPTVGIWRPVELRLIHQTFLADLTVQYRLSRDLQEAGLTLEAEVENLTPVRREELLEWRVEQEGKTVVRHSAPVELAPGLQTLIHSLTLDRPHLWWPAEAGPQSLYRAAVSIGNQGPKDEQGLSRGFGLRTMELIEEPDPTGRSFIFAVNGRRIFCRGANWAPTDLLKVDTPPDKIDLLLQRAREANMNMLRVWGGGIYESERFYDRCDELGIMIWQDFMYACSAYPDHEPAFLENARREAEWAVRSLRHHPSLVCWCGNNENEWIFSRTQSQNPTGETLAGTRLYTEILPQVLQRFDGTRPYRQSTPFGGEKPNSPLEGTQHFYKVGAGVDDEGRFDFRWSSFGPDAYRDHPGRFITEFGAYVGLPEPEHLDRFLSPASRRRDSDAWRAHLPHISHWPVSFQQLLDHQMSQLFGVLPEALSWEDYLAYARLVQGESLRLGFEAFRQNKPATGGALMWCLAGMWPSADWALIDHAGVPKPAFYFVHRALAPSMISISGQGDGFTVWGVHDGLEPLTARLRVQYGDFLQGSRWQDESEIIIPTDQAIPVCHVSWSELPVQDPRQEYLYAGLWNGETCLSRAVHLPASARMARFPAVTLSAGIVTREADRTVVRVSTDGFTYSLRLGCYGARFSDNYFHLLAGEEREVEVDLSGAHAPQIEVEAINARNSCRLGLEID